MKKTISLIIFFSCFASYSQVIQDWVARYPGSNDIPYTVAVDTAGNVYVIGSSFGIGGYDYVTIKYNSAGVEQWVQRYNGPGNGSDVAAALVIDDSANVYVTGYRYGGASGSDYNYTTIKYNTDGTEQWIQTYNGPDNSADGATAIAIDSIGNVYVTGYSIGNATGNDYATVKYNSSGVQQWAQRYDGPVHMNDLPSSIAVDDSGNTYITGWSMKTIFAGTEDYATIKYNSSGIQQWVQRYDGLDNDQDKATALAVDDTGNVYITGFSWGGGINFATIKYNTVGVQKWVGIYDGGSTDKPAALKMDAAGNLYITGWGYGMGEDYETVKYNNAGVQQWAARYDGGQTGGNSGDFAIALALDTSGNVYVTGESYGGIATFYDCATVKYDSMGVQQWVQVYTRTGYNIDYGNSITVDESANVYVTGVSEGNIITIKYIQPITGIAGSSEIPKDCLLFQNYPNPFNPSTVISYHLAVASQVNLKIFDILGNDVAILVNEEKPAGNYKVNWDASNFSSGVYFYQFQTEGYNMTKKLLLIK